MAITVQRVQPIAHLPLVLGVLRRLNVATIIDDMIPPILRMCSRVATGWRRCSWPSWTAIMHCISLALA